jgi:hypothetical protein
MGCKKTSYVAKTPHTQALCSITFGEDKKSSTLLNSEAKACLDQVAMDLQTQSNARAVVVGESDTAEKERTAKEEKAALRNRHIIVENLADQRAVIAKQYLVKDKSINAARIDIATSTANDQKVETYLVPSGADFLSEVHGTTPVDETSVMPQVHKQLAAKKHKKFAKQANQKNA